MPLISPSQQQMKISTAPAPHYEHLSHLSSNHLHSRLPSASPIYHTDPASDLDASRDMADESFTADYNGGFMDKLMFSPGYKCSPDISIEQDPAGPINPSSMYNPAASLIGRPDNQYLPKSRFGSRSLHMQQDDDTSSFSSGIMPHSFDGQSFNPASRTWINQSQGLSAKSASRFSVAPQPMQATIHGSSQNPLPKIGQVQYKPRNFDFNFENGSFASTMSTMTAYPDGFLGAFPEYDMNGRVAMNFGDKPVPDMTSSFSNIDSASSPKEFMFRPPTMVETSQLSVERNGKTGVDAIDAHFTHSSSSNASGSEQGSIVLSTSKALGTKSAPAFNSALRDNSSNSSGRSSNTIASNVSSNGTSISKGRSWQPQDLFLACFPKLSRSIPESNASSQKKIGRNIAAGENSNSLYLSRDSLQMLWADKHRPTSLDEFVCHAEQAQFLKQLISQGNCPHILFQGPRGSGKKTLIMALLREIFGPNSWKISYEEKSFKLKGDRDNLFRVPTVVSPYHVEVKASKLGDSARDVLISLLKEITAGIETNQIDIDGSLDFKVLVVQEVDNLPTDAQQLIRWLMDRYGDACKLLLCAEEPDKVVESIKSRSHQVNIEAPGIEEIVRVLQFVAEKEGFVLSDTLTSRIALESKQNLRHAVASLEACRSSQSNLKDNQSIPTGWEDVVVEVANDILTDQTPKRLVVARGKLQALLGKNVPPKLILQRLAEELVWRVDNQLKKEIGYWHGFYEKRIPAGSNSVSKLEEFVTKFVSIYKKFLKSSEQ